MFPRQKLEVFWDDSSRMEVLEMILNHWRCLRWSSSTGGVWDDPPPLKVFEMIPLHWRCLRWTSTSGDVLDDPPFPEVIWDDPPPLYLWDNLSPPPSPFSQPLEEKQQIRMPGRDLGSTVHQDLVVVNETEMGSPCRRPSLTDFTPWSHTGPSAFCVRARCWRTPH